MSLQFGADDDTPVADQEAVIRAFHDGTGRVVVDAAAGTGKTTTMLTTVAEVVVREVENGNNPFRKLVLTTFTKDAAGELKSRLKAILRNHVDAGGELPGDVFRWIETDSQIRTIDSLFHELLSEVSVEAGLPSNFEIEDGEELAVIRDELFSELRGDYYDVFQRLETAYPDESWRSYPPSSVREMIEEAQQKCREFCITPAVARQQMLINLDSGHGGYTPPESFDEVRQLLQEVVSQGASLSVDVTSDEDREAVEQEFLEHVKGTYEHSRQLVEDFTTILTEYEQRYDDRTREAGLLTYMDVTHVLREFVEEHETHPFVQSLRSRFKYVFVDEFQDTSTAQARVLRELVSKSNPRTNLLVIGDVKQSIYQWRSADPNLFSDIIERVRGTDGGARIPYFEVDDVVYRPLTSNFRSHPDLVRAANYVFDGVFDDSGRGAISDVNIDYVTVDAASGRRFWTADDSHLHVLDLDLEESGYPKRDQWTALEAERVAATIDAIVDDETETPVEIFETADEVRGTVSTRNPVPGDITLLFRTTTYMHQYAAALRERGIDAAPKINDDLFDRPEISVLVDILYWFSNPHEEGSLLRILRSPLVACSDATLRAVARHEFFLSALLEGDSWPSELPDDDRERIQDLLKLRDNLRWDREGSKSGLINRTLRHSAFDAVVLADEDGLRRYGNLWLLTELVDSWEEEELLSYREFVNRLVRIRERAQSNSGEPDYEVTEIADPGDETTVTLTTVHAAKGREFPVVFLCDLFKKSAFPMKQHERLVADRRRGFVLRPKAGDAPLPSNVSFDTPDSKGDSHWIHDDRDAGDYLDLTGPIWISDERVEETGEFYYSSPLNEFLGPSESEFWRMFYVAFTRAADHLFIGQSSIGEWPTKKTRWTTWMTTLNEYLEPDDGWGSHRGTTVNVGDESDTDSFPIGIDDVSTKDDAALPQIDIPDFEQFLTNEPMNVPETVPYRPLRISPSRIHDLVECPRRYQYQHVQQVAPYYKSMIEFDRDGERSAATSSPGGVAPNEWGTAVHDALEHRLDGKEALSSYVSQLEDPQREYVLWVVETLRREVDTYRTALEDSVEAYPEFSASTVLDVGGRRVHVTGDVDLLYEYEGEWHMVDYKTTKVPSADSYKAGKYNRQLRTYAWLLAREYDVRVSSASLLYIDVDDEAGEVTTDSVSVQLPTDEDAYEKELCESLQTVTVESPNGLSARPSPVRCDSCPYAASRGGPCEHGD
ncbi:UvrD-helicase domain-containing protein [Haloprofundus halobius]|uniref:UvrD-helicase domain-containing protein n=1 Tax=Haloprofundus halobius TaxID=2876194 RepID=UPI001CCC7A54